MPAGLKGNQLQIQLAGPYLSASFLRWNDYCSAKPEKPLLDQSNFHLDSSSLAVYWPEVKLHGSLRGVFGLLSGAELKGEKHGQNS